MFAYLWPLCLVVLSNTLYHICAKTIPRQANAMLSLAVAYGVGALISVILYFAASKNPHPVADFTRLNWASALLGCAIVGLEAGYIFMYRAGWSISLGPLVTNMSLTLVLIFIGVLAFHEHVGWSQLCGVALCLLGLILVNRP